MISVKGNQNHTLAGFQRRAEIGMSSCRMAQGPLAQSSCRAASIRLQTQMLWFEDASEVGEKMSGEVPAAVEASFAMKV